MMFISTPLLFAGLFLTAGLPEAKPGPPGDEPARVDTKLGAATEPPEPDIAPWISIRIPSDLHFSPDEKRLAFTVALPPKGPTWPQQVWVLDVASRIARPFTRSPKSEHSPRWSPDGKMLAFLSDREDRFQVYLLPSDGGEAERLTEGKNAVKAFEWSPDGTRIAFLAPDPKTDAEEKKETDKDDPRVVGKSDKRVRLWVVEVESKKVRPLTGGSWQVAEFAWAPKGDRLYAVATDRPEATDWKSQLLSVALDDGATQEIHAPAGPIRNLQVAPDGTSLTYLAAREDGPAPHDLFLLPLDGGSPRNLTAAGLDRPVPWHTWTRDGRLLALAEDGFRTRGLALTTGGKVESWPELDVNPSPQFARTDAGLLAFVGQTSMEPPEVWLLPPGSTPARATSLNGSFARSALIRPEYIRYASFDGTEIEAALYRPSGLVEGAKAPLVVLIHGGPTGRWADESARLTPQFLASHGYAVLCPNIRGSTGYGWAFLAKNRKDWGGGDFKDVMAGVDDLVRRGIADPDRLGIMGASYGGYMAAWAITQTTRFSAAVVIAGMSDLVSEFGTEGEQTQAYDRWYNGVPYEAQDVYLQSSPMSHIKKARTPTLILHGATDPIDPLGQAQQFHRGLTHYKVECELVIYPREGHRIVEEKHLVDFHRRFLGWFDGHLK